VKPAVVKLAAKEKTDFSLEVEYADSNSGEILISTARLIVRSSKSRYANTWVDLGQTDDELVIDGGKISVDIPASSMDFHGKGYYEIHIVTAEGAEGVLMEGQFEVGGTLL
jgi:hypothetical protein